MANICEYEIHVIGENKACRFIYESMPVLDDKELLRDDGTDYGDFYFKGDCKWSVDYQVSHKMATLDISKLSNEDISNIAGNYEMCSLMAKSKEFKCEILCHYWSYDSEYDKFVHYRNGEIIKQRNSVYGPRNTFDWDTTEFVELPAMSDASSNHLSTRVNTSSITDNSEAKKYTSVPCRWTNASICEYEIHVIGENKACRFIYESMPVLYDKELLRDDGTDYGDFYFKGDCKWSVNDRISHEMATLDLSKLSNEDISNIAGNYEMGSLMVKSKQFKCEILCHYWSCDSEYDNFVHYKNGKIIKKRKSVYSPRNTFDWDTTELVEMAVMSDANSNHLSTVVNTSSKVIEKSKTKEGTSVPCKWTFAMGNRVEGPGWSIAVPDGFVARKSDGNLAYRARKRLFEIVPDSYRDIYSHSLIPIPVLIYPKGVSDGGRNTEYHQKAWKGYVADDACIAAREIYEKSGNNVWVMVEAWDNLYATIIVENTGENAYDYMIRVILNVTDLLFEIQAQNISDEQKKDLDKSVCEWIRTMVYTETELDYPDEPVIDTEECFEEAKRGKLRVFRAAVQQAKEDCDWTVGGQMSILELMEEEKIAVESAGKTIMKLLREGLELKEFYYEKFDAFIDRLIASEVDLSVLKKCYTELRDLERDVINYELNTKEFAVEIPSRIKEILEKWKVHNKAIPSIKRRKN